MANHSSPLGYGGRSSVKRMLLIDALANCALDQTNLHCDVQPATQSTIASVWTTLDLKTDHDCNQLATTLETDARTKPTNGQGRKKLLGHSLDAKLTIQSSVASVT